MGPSVMGKLKKHSQFLDAVFSVPSLMSLETMGNIGLIYFLFLLGLEMDITTIARVGKKPLAIAITGTFVPFLIGLAAYYPSSFHSLEKISSWVPSFGALASPSQAYP